MTPFQSRVILSRSAYRPNNGFMCNVMIKSLYIEIAAVATIISDERHVDGRLDTLNKKKRGDGVSNQILVQLPRDYRRTCQKVIIGSRY
jgi:hypothetical protein